MGDIEHPRATAHVCAGATEQINSPFFVGRKHRTRLPGTAERATANPPRSHSGMVGALLGPLLRKQSLHLGIRGGVNMNPFVQRVGANAARRLSRRCDSTTTGFRDKRTLPPRQCLLRERGESLSCDGHVQRIPRESPILEFIRINTSDRTFSSYSSAFGESLPITCTLHRQLLLQTTECCVLTPSNSIDPSEPRTADTIDQKSVRLVQYSANKGPMSTLRTTKAMVQNKNLQELPPISDNSYS